MADSATLMDYADQRYYFNVNGRLMTPDPYAKSARLTDPQSWNRYAYTRGDPVNRFDPGGTDDCTPSPGVTFCVTGTGTTGPPPSIISLDDSWWDTGSFGRTILDSYYTSQITARNKRDRE